MQYLLILGLMTLYIKQCVFLPTTKDKGTEGTETKLKDEGFQAEFQRYADEFIESSMINNPVFPSNLETFEKNKGEQNKMRSKIDELERLEIERLKHLAELKNAIKNGIDKDNSEIRHLNKNNEDFEIEKLISETAEDLRKIDNLRRENFKKYEMQQEFEREQRMMRNTGEDKEIRLPVKESRSRIRKKEKRRESIHYPGSKKQLEEVWKEQDHMENEALNPKTFFYLHDLDGNKFWDQQEVKALFLKELDKIYTDGSSEKEILKRAEEMERMREQVFREFDFNNDGLLSYHEFVEQIKNPNFRDDQVWKTLEEEQIFSPEEYQAYKNSRPTVAET